MSSPQQSSPRPAGARPARGAVERLYVYWVVSTVLLVLAWLVTAVVTRGTLHRQTQVIDELRDRVSELEQRVPAVETPASTAAPARERPASPRVREGLEKAPDLPAHADSGAPPALAEDRSLRPPVATELAPPSQHVIDMQLNEVVSDDPVTPADVADPNVAAELLETALRHVGRVRWSGATWSRLAVLARLLGRDVAAEALAEQASSGGDPLINYAEVSARALLARGRPQEALATVASLVEQTARPTPRVLLAAALWATDDPASADETLETLPVPVVLPTYDKLLLARVLFHLEHWDRLEAVLSTVHDVPEELAAERGFLLASSLVHDDRTVEALAILDGLVAEPRAEAEAMAPQAGAAWSPGWPVPRPDRYEIEVWRGIALTYAQQAESARETLRQAAQLDPGRGEASYYLGVLEARFGRPDIAVAHLKNALATAPRLAPAWEALAVLEIENGKVGPALDCLARAVKINFRRASAHFLTAVAQAKVAQRERAAAALRIAIGLDESYLATAKQTDVLTRLFTPEELDQLAAEPGLKELSPPQPE